MPPIWLQTSQATSKRTTPGGAPRPLAVASPSPRAVMPNSLRRAATALELAAAAAGTRVVAPHARARAAHRLLRSVMVVMAVPRVAGAHRFLELGQRVLERVE